MSTTAQSPAGRRTGESKVSEPGTPPATGTTVQGWRRPGPTPKEQKYDLLLGLGMAVAAVIGTELARGAAPNQVDLGIGGIEPYVLSAAGALPLCFRRRWPIPVLLIVSVVFVVAGERATFAFAGNLITRRPSSWRSTRRSPGRGTGG